MLWPHESCPGSPEDPSPSLAGPSEDVTSLDDPEADHDSESLTLSESELKSLADSLEELDPPELDSSQLDEFSLELLLDSSAEDELVSSLLLESSHSSKEVVIDTVPLQPSSRSSSPVQSISTPNWDA